MKKVACIIVNYNDSLRTKKLVENIQFFGSIDFIIVVDNCSSDNSCSVLETIKSDKYYFIKSPRNGGYGAGNNCGARKAFDLGADYILIANPDVCFSNECVLHMEQTMADNPSCAIVGAKEVKLGTWAWRYTSAFYDVLSTSLFFNKILKKRCYPKEYFSNKDCVEADVIPGCFLLVDLTKFLEVGGYDESIFLYEEEKTLYCKFKNRYVSIVDLCVEYEHNHVESHSYTLKSMLLGKKRLIAGRLTFLKYYRNFNSLQLLLARIFFGLTLVEMLLWNFSRKIIK